MADFVDLSSYNTNDLPQGEIYPDDTEIQARITRISKGKDKNQTPYLMPWFEDPNNVNLEDFSDYLPLPVPTDTEKEKGRKLLKLKTFAQCFDLDLFGGEFNLEDAKGALGWMILGIGKSKEGTPNNRPKKYLLESDS
jgi:hypothetical protein